MNNKSEAIASHKDGIILQIEVTHSKTRKAYEITAVHARLQFNKGMSGRSTIVSIHNTFYKSIGFPVARASKKAEEAVIEKMHALKNEIFAESCRFEGFPEVEPEWVDYVNAEMLPEAVKE